MDIKLLLLIAAAGGLVGWGIARAVYYFVSRIMKYNPDE